MAHQTPDRVPMDLGATDMTEIDGGPRRLAPLLGIAAGAAGVDTDEAVLQARDLVRTLGASGGYILSAAHTLQEDVPNENILAFYRAATEVSS